MEERINFLQVPHHYLMCLNRKCLKADTCLRQLVEQCVPIDIQSWVIISPKYLAVLEGDCPHYRSTVKVRFAKGFLNILENLPYKQMRAVVSQLIVLFGRRTYYRVRKGERLLSPSEQQQFFLILKNCSVSSFGEFDAYLEDYDW